VSAILAQGLGKRFGARTAVEGLSFTVEPGEVFGLLGPNGAGKTTTVRMLSGLLRPSAGGAVVAGLSVLEHPDALRGRIGLLTEQPGLYDRLTGRENLEFFVRLHGLAKGTAWARADALLERLELADRLEEPCGGYSKGMRQKLAIVRALLHAPEVVFLDEPTSGLDPASARSVRQVISELAAEGRAVVLCSHNLGEVERLCARVAVIQGRLLAVEPVGALLRAGHGLELQLGGPAEPFAAKVRALPFSPKVSAVGNVLEVAFTHQEYAPEVIAALIAHGARIHAAVPTEQGLEDAYLALTGGPGREPGGSA
jgi:ABC-2 type transport system ATP-binding protein